MTTTERVIHLHLICEAPPVDPRTEFGLQGAAGTLTPGTVAPDGTLRFEMDCRAVTLADGTVRLRGPIVHGPPAAPFLYLSCRPVNSATSPWIFRLKVPLAGVDPSAEALEGRIRVSRGGSAPLVDGWLRANP